MKIMHTKHTKNLLLMCTTFCLLISTPLAQAMNLYEQHLHSINEFRSILLELRRKYYANKDTSFLKKATCAFTTALDDYNINNNYYTINMHDIIPLEFPLITQTIYIKNFYLIALLQSDTACCKTLREKTEFLELTIRYTEALHGYHSIFLNKGNTKSSKRKKIIDEIAQIYSTEDVRLNIDDSSDSDNEYSDDIWRYISKKNTSFHKTMCLQLIQEQKTCEKIIRSHAVEQCPPRGFPTLYAFICYCTLIFLCLKVNLTPAYYEHTYLGLFIFFVSAFYPYFGVIKKNLLEYDRGILYKAQKKQIQRFLDYHYYDSIQETVTYKDLLPYKKYFESLYLKAKTTIELNKHTDCLKRYSKDPSEENMMLCLKILLEQEDKFLFYDRD